MGEADSRRAGIQSGKDRTGSDARVYVVVLNYDDWASTGRCVASLARTSSEDFRVVVVDNGSHSGPPDALSKSVPGLVILLNGRNLGYGQGNQRGIRYAMDRGAEFVWLLNNDAEAEADALERMVAVCEQDPEVGAVGSVIIDTDSTHRVQAWGGGRVSFLTGLPQHVREPGARLDYLCGASVLLRCGAIRKVGSFDDRFFMYWEDTDLSFRLRRAGWKLAVADGSRVRHASSSTSVFQSAFYDHHFTASSVVFFRLHSGLWWLPVLVSATGRFTRRLLAGKPGNARAVWHGVRCGLRAGRTG